MLALCWLLCNSRSTHHHLLTLQSAPALPFGVLGCGCGCVDVLLTVLLEGNAVLHGVLGTLCSTADTQQQTHNGPAVYTTSLAAGEAGEAHWSCGGNSLDCHCCIPYLMLIRMPRRCHQDTARSLGAAP